MSSSSFNLIENSTVPMPTSKGMRVGLVVSEWNGSITEELQKGAVKTLVANGVDENNIIVYPVPGSFELIYGCARLAKGGKVDAIIAIGCVIRGDTPHFDYICQAVSVGLSRLNSEGEVPIIFGLLTTNSQEQAEERSGGILGNKGDEYAITAIKMIDYARRVK